MKATATLRGESSGEHWACYHTDLYRLTHDGIELGIVPSAVGASFAVLIAEQLFASGCRLLISITSSGQLAAVRSPPYFILIEKGEGGLGGGCTVSHFLDSQGLGTAQVSNISLW